MYKLSKYNTNTTNEIDKSIATRNISCLQEQATIKARYELTFNSSSFTCALQRNFESEEECIWQEKYAKTFYEDNSVLNRLENCSNYFNTIQNVAYWPVSFNIGLILSYLIRRYFFFFL